MKVLKTLKIIGIILFKIIAYTFIGIFTFIAICAKYEAVENKKWTMRRAQRDEKFPLCRYKTVEEAHDARREAGMYGSGQESYDDYEYLKRMYDTR